MHKELDLGMAEMWQKFAAENAMWARQAVDSLTRSRAPKRRAMLIKRAIMHQTAAEYYYKSAREYMGLTGV